MDDVAGNICRALATGLTLTPVAGKPRGAVPVLLKNAKTVVMPYGLPVGAYTRPLCTSTYVVSDTKCTNNTH
jgi:hypothetical protein